MKLIKTFLLIISFVASTLSYAYVLDPTTKIVTDEASGKEWLQWTETTNFSINGAISIYNLDGWRLATNTEMARLFSDFFVQIELTDDQTVRQAFSGEFGDGIDPVVELGKRFGWTEYENSVNVASGDTLAFNNFSTSIVKFGSDTGGANPYNSLTMNSEFSFFRDDLLVGRPERAALDFNVYTGSSDGNGRIGVALVRETSTSEVPEPSSLILLGLGLFGLAYSCRKASLGQV